MEMFRYAHQNGCQWDESTCARAALHGRLDFLKYAYGDESTCANAAQNDQLDCLLYAHENGCKWDESTCVNAAFNGKHNNLRYALGQGCPSGIQTLTAAIGGASQSVFDIWEWGFKSHEILR